MGHEFDKFVDKLDRFSQNRFSEIQNKFGEQSAALVAKELERMKLEVLKQIKELILDD